MENDEVESVKPHVSNVKSSSFNRDAQNGTAEGL